jgi:hypothetical protein
MDKIDFPPIVVLIPKKTKLVFRELSLGMPVNYLKPPPSLL